MQKKQKIIQNFATKRANRPYNGVIFNRCGCKNTPFFLKPSFF